MLLVPSFIVENTQAQRLKEAATSLTIELDPRLSNAINEIHRRYEAGLREMAPRFQQLLRKAAAMSREFDEAIAPLKPGLARVMAGLAKLPSKLRRALMLLAEHGWYMDPNMTVPELWALEHELNASHDAAVRLIASHFRIRAPEILSDLEKRFPHRSRVLLAARRAHDNGEYEASVALFLIQADGICHDATKKSPFRRSKQQPQLAEFVSELQADSFTSIMLYPLTQKLPIYANASERQPGFKGLNRHMVLHGESLDYGTEENSLKAISLLNYVTHAVGIKGPKKRDVTRSGGLSPA